MRITDIIKYNKIGQEIDKKIDEVLYRLKSKYYDEHGDRPDIDHNYFVVDEINNYINVRIGSLMSEHWLSIPFQVITEDIDGFDFIEEYYPKFEMMFNSKNYKR